MNYIFYSDKTQNKMYKMFPLILSPFILHYFYKLAFLIVLLKQRIHLTQKSRNTGSGLRDRLSVVIHAYDSKLNTDIINNDVTRFLVLIIYLFD